MSKIYVTDIEHIPEGPPRDLMLYLQDNGEAIQRLDRSLFWTTIISYVVAYYEADDGGPLEMTIAHLFSLLIPCIDHAKKTLTKEVDDG